MHVFKSSNLLVATILHIVPEKSPNLHVRVNSISLFHEYIPPQLFFSSQILFLVLSSSARVYVSYHHAFTQRMLSYTCTFILLFFFLHHFQFARQRARLGPKQTPFFFAWQIDFHPKRVAQFFWEFLKLRAIFFCFANKRGVLSAIVQTFAIKRDEIK